MTQVKDSVRKYGQPPYRIGLLHGGPGAAGEMKPVAVKLSDNLGILELLQTERSVTGQVEELHRQLLSYAGLPVTLVGYSWGAWLGLLFSAAYPDMVSKLILISSGSLESRYNQDLMKIRQGRMSAQEQDKLQKLMLLISSGNTDNETMACFGELISKADSYEPVPEPNDIDPDMDIFKSVWAEASQMRESGELISRVSGIKCPVVAIHGRYDPHPAEGVEKPLSERLPGFRMIYLDKCGHTPWLEKSAGDLFYELLRKELMEK